MPGLYEEMKLPETTTSTPWLNPPHQGHQRATANLFQEPGCRQTQRSSNTIPLPSYHIPRTPSELQLSEDMEIAEWRELSMFYRVVHGIRERQEQRKIGKVILITTTAYPRGRLEDPVLPLQQHRWDNSGDDGWSMTGYSHTAETLPRTQTTKRFMPFCHSSFAGGAMRMEDPTLKHNTETASTFRDEDTGIFALEL